MLKSAGFPCQNISASVRWDICREQFFLKYSSLLMTSRLKEVFDYAENPDKTIGKKYVDSDLFAALQYAADDKKTDDGNEKMLWQNRRQCSISRVSELSDGQKV